MRNHVHLVLRTRTRTGCAAAIAPFIPQRASPPQTRDTLFGVASGDRLDLSAIDAVAGGGNDAFAFIGTAAFTAAGQVRLVQSGPGWLLEANVDASLAADLVIAITPDGGYVPVAADLIL